MEKFDISARKSYLLGREPLIFESYLNILYSRYIDNILCRQHILNVVIL